MISCCGGRQNVSRQQEFLKLRQVRRSCTLDGLHVHRDRARHEQHHLVSDLDLVETRHTRIDEDLACLSVCRREGDDALIVVEGGDRVGHLDGREVGIAARRRLRLKKYLL